MKNERRSSLALDIHGGVPGAVERMVLEHQDGLYGYALALLRDPFDAQEVAQDAFIRAHRALTATYDSGKCRQIELRPWLYRITRNLALNRRRARRARPESPMEAEEYARILDGRQAGLSAREKRSVAPWLEAAFSTLGVGDRELLELRFIEGLSFAEIAGVLGATESSARGRAFRAARRLRRKMTEGRNEV